MAKELTHPNYKCPKCNNRKYTSESISTTGSGWSRIFDMQNKKFTAVSCNNCGFTELYKGKHSNLSNIFDFFTS